MFMLDISTELLVGLGVSIFTAGFLCTQYLSNVLTLDALVTFLTATGIVCFGMEWLAKLTQGDPIDALHGYLLILVTSVMLVPAFIWFLSTDPADVTIRTALALTRLLGFGMTSFMTFLEQNQNGTFSEEGFYYIILPLGTMTGVYAIHLLYNSRVNTNIRYGNLNHHLHSDLLMSFVWGLLCFCIPESLAAHFDQTLNPLHTYLYRIYGLLLISEVGLPWLAPKFRSSANKRAVLFAKALSMLVILSVTFHKYRKGDIPEGTGSKMLIAILIILTLPSAVGSMRFDQGTGWDLPWRGLRVPDVQVGGSAPSDIYQQVKKEIRRRSPKGKGKRARSYRR